MTKQFFIAQFIKENEHQLKQNVIDDVHCCAKIPCADCPFTNPFVVCSENLAEYIKTNFKEWFL